MINKGYLKYPSQGTPRGTMLKKPGPGGSREVLLPHGPEWNAMMRDMENILKHRKATKFQVKVTCILYRNGRLSSRNEVLARSKRQHYNKPRILGSKKKLWLNIHSSSCILLLLSRPLSPRWMAFGRLEGAPPPRAPFFAVPAVGEEGGMFAWR